MERPPPPCWLIVVGGVERMNVSAERAAVGRAAVAEQTNSGRACVCRTSSFSSRPPTTFSVSYEQHIM